MKGDAGRAKKFWPAGTTLCVERTTACACSAEEDGRKALVKRVDHVDLRTLSGGVGIGRGNHTSDWVDGNALRRLRESTERQVRVAIENSAARCRVVYSLRERVSESGAVDHALHDERPVKVDLVRVSHFHARNKDRAWREGIESVIGRGHNGDQSGGERDVLNADGGAAETAWRNDGRVCVREHGDLGIKTRRHADLAGDARRHGGWSLLRSGDAIVESWVQVKKETNQSRRRIGGG